jgi:hypothetical protein
MEIEVIDHSKEDAGAEWPWLALRFKAPIFVKYRVCPSEGERLPPREEPEYYAPGYWRNKEGKKVRKIIVGKIEGTGEDIVYTPEEIYEGHVKSCTDIYIALVANGVCPKQASMLLPQSMITEWIQKLPVRSFYWLYERTMKYSPSKEVKEFTKELERAVKTVFPKYWKELKNE